MEVELRSNGVSVATADADATGKFSFSTVNPGTYEVVPVFADWIFSPAAQTVTTTSGVVELPSFAVVAETAGNTADELAHHEEMEALFPFPGFGALGLSADRKTALAADAPVPGDPRRTWIINQMVAKAKEFACPNDKPSCDTWRRDAGPDPGVEPAQLRLAYLWGSETTDPRRGPETGSRCSMRLHGLDCNGLVYGSARFADIQIPDLGAWAQGDPENWPIPPEWNVRLVKLPAASYKKGDIVVWPQNKAHVGIAIEDGNDPYVVSSTGSYDSSCATNIAKGPKPLRASWIKQVVVKDSSGTVISKTTTLPSHVLRFVADPEFSLNVKTSWRPKFFGYDSYSGTVVTVPLTSLNDGNPLPLGASLELTALGQWYYNSFGQVGSGAAGRLLAGSSVVQPGPGSTTFSGGVPADCSAGGDPYPGDFLMAIGTTHKVALPAGTTNLELAVDDCVMYDNNPVLADPIRVKVKLILPAQ